MMDSGARESRNYIIYSVNKADVSEVDVSCSVPSSKRADSGGLQAAPRSLYLRSVPDRGPTRVLDAGNHCVISEAESKSPTLRCNKERSDRRYRRCRFDLGFDCVVCQWSLDGMRQDLFKRHKLHRPFDGAEAPLCARPAAGRRHSMASRRITRCTFCNRYEEIVHRATS